VTRGYPSGLMNASEINQWLDEYDNSDVIEREVDLRNIHWRRCYASDLLRAKITAEKVFDGEINFKQTLREIRLTTLFKRIRLPILLHLIFIRLAWNFNMISQPESKQEVLLRINEILDEILAEPEDVLIVGHGGLMLFMHRELKKRGFKGPSFNRPANGKLYLYEK
jgi:broad specificity phosphatase PhoE